MEPVINLQGILKVFKKLENSYTKTVSKKRVHFDNDDFCVVRHKNSDSSNSNIQKLVFYKKEENYDIVIYEVEFNVSLKRLYWLNTDFVEQIFNLVVANGLLNEVVYYKVQFDMCTKKYITKMINGLNGDYLKEKNHLNNPVYLTPYEADTIRDYENKKRNQESIERLKEESIEIADIMLGMTKYLATIHDLMEEIAKGNENKVKKLQETKVHLLLELEEKINDTEYIEVYYQ